MGFDIQFDWRETTADAEARNETLATSLLAAFPMLHRFPLDFEAIARSIGVARDQVLQHWCQIELDDKQGTLANAIITFWRSSVIVQLPSSPNGGPAATLAVLSPLFSALENAGMEVDRSFDVLAEYQLQAQRVEQVARIVGERR